MDKPDLRQGNEGGALTDAEKKELSDFGLSQAMWRASVLSSAKDMLLAAIQTLRSYQCAHNSYARDPEIETVRRSVEKVAWSIPGGEEFEEIAEAVGGAERGEWDYYEPNDEYRLRLKEAGLQDREDDFPEVPWVKPLDMYKRYKK